MSVGYHPRRAITERLTVKAKKQTKTAKRAKVVEPPTKTTGHPFFSMRVPAPLLRAWKAHAKKKKTTGALLLKAYMSKLTGIELTGIEDASRPEAGDE